MAQVLSFVLPAVVICFLLQRTCRRRMDTAQYNYFRDLALVSVWLLSALWAGSDVSRFIVGMAVFASMAGT
ncbi:MAG: glycosyltransferase, partial [Synergistaceae bacterium]|nr:glycosyltransferase [Synergistaceae bacterium]